MVIELVGTANEHLRYLRPGGMTMTSSDLKKRLEELRKLAPYDRDVAAYVCNWGGLTAQQVQTLYEPVLPYAAHAMEKVASTALNQPDRYEELLSKAAALNPSDYFKLGDYFAARKQDALAAKYYEKGTESDPDTVRASNHAAYLPNLPGSRAVPQRAHSGRSETSPDGGADRFHCRVRAGILQANRNAEQQLNRD